MSVYQGYWHLPFFLCVYLYLALMSRLCQSCKGNSYYSFNTRQNSAVKPPQSRFLFDGSFFFLLLFWLYLYVVVLFRFLFLHDSLLVKCISPGFCTCLLCYLSCWHRAFLNSLQLFLCVYVMSAIMSHFSPLILFSWTFSHFL